jgi:hypothetical protein
MEKMEEDKALQSPPIKTRRVEKTDGDEKGFFN